MPCTAANKCPPLLNNTSRQPRIENSLNGRRSSINIVNNFNLSEKPTRINKPDG